MHKGQPLFEKLMLRTGFYARGLRMASTGPWATLDRCVVNVLAVCKDTRHP